MANVNLPASKEPPDFGVISVIVTVCRSTPPFSTSKRPGCRTFIGRKNVFSVASSSGLRAVNQHLTAIVDVDAFLQVSYQTGGSMVGSQKLLWPHDIKEQLGLFLGIMDKLAADGAHKRSKRGLNEAATRSRDWRA
jgi:hypothetical protein